MPVIFSKVYGQSAEIAGLQYIALGIGLSLASLANAFYVDRIYLYLKNRNEGVDEPEYRLRSSPTLPLAMMLRIYTLMNVLFACSIYGSRHPALASRAPDLRVVVAGALTLDPD